MSDKPEALLLADALLGCAGPLLPILPAAAELRRQHAEIERLYAQQTDYEDAIASSKDDVSMLRECVSAVSADRERLRAECDALRAELREVTEAMNDPAVNNIRTLAESIRILQAERDALRAASKAVVDFVDGPSEAKRPEVFFRLIGDLRAAIDAAREAGK